jgi:hypothetical protein
MRSLIRELTGLVRCPCCYTDMLLVNFRLEREMYRCPYCGFKKEVKPSPVNC